MYKTLAHPTSRLPQLQVNDDYATFIYFHTFLKNSWVVSRTKDAVFLWGVALSDEDNEDPNILNYVPISSNKDQINSSKTIYDSGQQLKLTRDGHCENMTLDSVDFDMYTMVLSYGVRL